MAHDKFNLDQYEEYIAHTNKHARIVETMLIWLKELIVGFKGKTIRVLDVGCGPGQLTSRLTWHFDAMSGQGPTHTPAIDWTCLDASSEALSRCKKACSASRLTHTKMRFLATSLYDYLLKNQEMTRFDIIICSHVLYYTGHWATCLDDLRSLLARDGQLWIAHASRNAEIHRVFDNISLYVSDEPEYVVCFAEDLEETLVERKALYDKEMPTSEITFDSKEAEAFLSSENTSSIANVLGFLWGYSGASINSKKVIPQIRKILQNKIKSHYQQIGFEYRDGLFRIRGHS
jgi:SAM-dependent methyltransferase